MYTVNTFYPTLESVLLRGFLTSNVTVTAGKVLIHRYEKQLLILCMLTLTGQGQMQSYRGYGVALAEGNIHQWHSFL